MRKLNAADLFCGAGGTSQGARQAGARVRFALNHWQTAVETHSANFPEARHVNSRLDQVSPGEAEAMDVLFASPECTHHSRARGGRPTSDQQRSGAWQVLPWIEHHRPSFVVIENVVEFREWGPVGASGRPLESKRGATFGAWLTSIESLGYKVDHHELNAADFGAATSRNRLFVIARKGNRSPLFPEPSHSRRAGGELPGMGVHPWRAAAEVIDWSLPCPSIFSRQRPLADKTLQRIEAGLRRFVGPFVAQWDHQSGGGSYTRDIRGPLGTFTTKANMGMTVPFMTEVNHGVDPRLSGITGHGAGAVCAPWLGHYYGTDNQSPLTDPVDTITTKARHSLCVARVGTPNDSRCSCSPAQRKLCDTMREIGVADIGFRMLQNHELSAAQGFPACYLFCGNKADVTRQIGNSVSPNVAEAITAAILSS